MKTAEELNSLKNELVILKKKLAELNEEELAQVAGGTTDGDNSLSPKRKKRPHAEEPEGEALARRKPVPWPIDTDID